MEARGDPVLDWNKQNLKFKITGPMDGVEKDSSLSKLHEVADMRVPF